MTIHIDAKPGDIAETVLLPGDPLRARYIAETFLEDARLYSGVRNMLGYTGTYHGVPVSVQGTGMGVPSMCIYAYELIHVYGARRLIRVGTAGALKPELGLGALVIALAASTDSAINRHRFAGADYAPTASFALLRAAMAAAARISLDIHAGNVLTSDEFYQDDPRYWEQWARFGVLCAEMETAGLYTVAAGGGAQALAILTISDSLVTSGLEMSPKERERGTHAMIQLALETAVHSG